MVHGFGVHEIVIWLSVRVHVKSRRRGKIGRMIWVFTQSLACAGLLFTARMAIV